MIIKVKEKQKYIKVYDINMNLIRSFYTLKEASEYINIIESSLWSAKKRNIPLHGKYYIKTEGSAFIEYNKKIDSYTVIRKYTECNSCGVTLCEKNEFLTANVDARKKGIKYRYSKCSHCTRKRNVCRVRYSNIELQKLSVKQNEIIYNKSFWHQNKSDINIATKKRESIYRNNLHDSYIIKCLKNSATVSKALGRTIKTEEITPSMMDIQRKSILLTRKLK